MKNKKMKKYSLFLLFTTLFLFFVSCTGQITESSPIESSPIVKAPISDAVARLVVEGETLIIFDQRTQIQSNGIQNKGYKEVRILPSASKILSVESGAFFGNQVDRLSAYEKAYFLTKYPSSYAFDSSIKTVSILNAAGEAKAIFTEDEIGGRNLRIVKFSNWVDYYSTVRDYSDQKITSVTIDKGINNFSGKRFYGGPESIEVVTLSENLYNSLGLQKRVEYFGLAMMYRTHEGKVLEANNAIFSEGNERHLILDSPYSKPILGTGKYENKGITKVTIKHRYSSIAKGALAGNPVHTLSAYEDRYFITGYPSLDGAFDSSIKTVNILNAAGEVKAKITEDEVGGRNLRIVKFSNWVDYYFTVRDYSDQRITSVTIDKGINNFSGKRFYGGLESIEVVTLSEELYNWLSRKDKLKSYFGDVALYQTHESRRLNIEKVVEEEIIDNVVTYENGLKKLTFSSGATNVKERAFRGQNLKLLEIPSSIDDISFGAFQDNELTEINLPDNLRKLGSAAFLNNKLRKITIPRLISHIDWSTFFNNHLEEINLPQGLIRIDGYAFARNRLRQITLPKKIMHVGYNAFAENKDLTTVVLSENLYNSISDKTNVFGPQVTNYVTHEGKKLN